MSREQKRRIMQQIDRIDLVLDDWDTYRNMQPSQIEHLKNKKDTLWQSILDGEI